MAGAGVNGARHFLSARDATSRRMLRAQQRRDPRPRLPPGGPTRARCRNRTGSECRRQGQSALASATSRPPARKAATSLCDSSRQCGCARLAEDHTRVSAVHSAARSTKAGSPLLGIENRASYSDVRSRRSRNSRKAGIGAAPSSSRSSASVLLPSHSSLLTAHCLLLTAHCSLASRSASSSTSRSIPLSSVRSRGPR
jgi:hypothetical protein